MLNSMKERNLARHASGFAKQVVQEFSHYNNTLLFTVANELASRFRIFRDA